ncbi:MAG: LysM peptidoglycan-binding domain-containing protein [Roseburia sp.]|nr:LysM peptidoglycan-binding domain-containing protein [Roseburia sp.]MCM1098097.1 LysM peptidoglycan-binding domain-containing protein [Ruminococcus flavefaciens]
MGEQKSLREMNDRELRSCKRSLRLQRKRRRRIRSMALLFLAVIGMAIIFAASYNTISSSASSGFKYYTQITVEAGDTLWDLADTFMDQNSYRDKNSYIAEVRSINHLDEEETLLTGQKLIVPYYSTEYKQ